MYEDEYLLIRATSVIKRVLFKWEEKPPKKDYLFVGVSWDKSLTDKLDDDGLPIGNQAITDRAKLAQFLSILNQKPDNHRFLVLDIFFKDPSPDDSTLQSEFYRTKNYLVSYHKNSEGKPDYPIFTCDIGLSDYENTEEGLLGVSAGGFSKFKMMQGDSLTTLPLKMYLQFNPHAKFKQGFLWNYLHGVPVFKSFVVDHRIRAYDLFDAPDSLLYDKVYLGELLYLPAEAVHELTKDRIIILGDFEDRDIHPTIYGDMPGSLILLNAFLALHYGDANIHFGFVLLLFVGFWLISYKCFYHKDPIFGHLLNRFTKINLEVKNSLLSNLTYILVLSVTSFFLFDIHLSVLFLTIYLQMVGFVLDKFFKK